MKYLFLISFLIIVSEPIYVNGQRSRAAQHFDLTLDTGIKDNVKIAFGSCYGLWDRKSDIFETIANQPPSETSQPAVPDLFVWLGDVAYVDSTELLFRLMPEEYVRKRYADTLKAKGYDQLQRVVGIWDDHDYGQNDAGKEMLDRDRNREIFLDFINEPADSDRRTQEGTAIFQDYYIKTDAHLVHLILLDNRYDYDRETKDRLGPVQWQWLEDVIQEGIQKNVTQTIIGAGIQMIMQRQAITMETFEWPSKKQLFDILKKYQLSNVVLISGDVHFAQMHENKCRSLTGMKLVEITSSGLSHSYRDHVSDTNITAKTFTPTFFTTSDPYAELNFGNVIIDKQGTITLEARNYWGQVILSEKVTKEELSFDEKSLRFSSDFCESKLGTQLWFEYFEHVIELWIQLHTNSLGWLALAVPLICSGITATILTIFRFMLNCLQWLFSSKNQAVIQSSFKSMHISRKKKKLSFRTILSQNPRLARLIRQSHHNSNSTAARIFKKGVKRGIREVMRIVDTPGGRL